MLAPEEAEVELDGPAVVRSGYELRHGLLVRDRSGRGLALATSGAVTGTVVDPATGDVVGGFSGWLPASVQPGARQPEDSGNAAHRHRLTCGSALASLFLVALE